MALVHPVIEPQIALRACKGRFFGIEQEWLAALYSNRIVFTPLEKLPFPEPSQPAQVDEDEILEEVSIGIPQPPMTLGDAEGEVLPNTGGVFFAIGRNRDMLVMQFNTCLVTLSINTVTLSLELQGLWGLPKAKEAPTLHDKVSQVQSRVQGAASLVSIAENTSISAPPIQGSRSSASGGRSGLTLDSQLPPPKASPYGTSIFLVCRNKYHVHVLLILSSYGKELIRSEFECLDILTYGWISEEMVYFVYMNQNFHKKFQVMRLANKAKATGLFGMGKKAIKPSLLYDMNIPIAPDFRASIPETCSGPDLVFKDCVLLGTKNGGYVRVNFQSGTWEPVFNAKGVVGAVSLGESAVIVQTNSQLSQDASAIATSQFNYSLVSNGIVHALRAEAEVGNALASKHEIDGDNRFALKLLNIGDGYILDYKRRPFRLYRYRSNPTGKITLADTLPAPGSPNSKVSKDFLVKSEQALYMRNPNGDDNSIHKIVDRDTVLDITLDRFGLIELERRDVKSFYASFTSVNGMSPKINILEESHSKLNRMKYKVMFDFAAEFGGKYARWHLLKTKAIHRNILLVALSSKKESFISQKIGQPDAEVYDWALLMLVFVGSTYKRDPIPPKGVVLLESKYPELPPSLLPNAQSPNKFVFYIYDARHGGFSRKFSLTADNTGEYKFEEMKDHAPIALDRCEGATVFADIHGSLDNLYMAGTYSGSERVANVLVIESPARLSDGTTIVLGGSDPFRTTIWNFDSDGVAFREFRARDIHPSKIAHHQRYEQIIKNYQKRREQFTDVDLSPDFLVKHFVEVSSNSEFRALPEIGALVCRGIGYGVDAEVYIKTPDDGVYAVFRLQNEKLHQSLMKLHRTILERRVGSWLTEELKGPWLERCQSSSMITGSAFGAYWKLSPEEQEELCTIAGVDSQLIKKLRPP